MKIRISLLELLLFQVLIALNLLCFRSSSVGMSISAGTVLLAAIIAALTWPIFKPWEELLKVRAMMRWISADLFVVLSVLIIRFCVR